METTTATWIPEGLTVRQDWAGRDDEDRCGTVLVGSPGVLSQLAARLGFRNACRDGRLYITGAKVRWLKEVR